jgi:hypothetical protein
MGGRSDRDWCPCRLVESECNTDATVDRQRQSTLGALTARPNLDVVPNEGLTPLEPRDLMDSSKPRFQPNRWTSCARSGGLHWLRRGGLKWLHFASVGVCG